MPLTEDRYIHGIYEIGEWSATSVTGGGDTSQYHEDNEYTLTPWATTEETGATISPSVNKVDLYGGQSTALKDSFINQVTAKLQTNFISGTLDIIKKMWGLPDAAHTGDLSADPATDEVLRVNAAQIGTQERQIYVKAAGGGDGPRTWFFPRCKPSDLSEMAISKTDYLKPGGAFDLYENADRDLFWAVDAAA